MTVTATELKSNLGRYLQLAASEDIIVKKNGTPIARLTSAYGDRSQRMRELFGILPDTVTVEEARSIRGEEKWQLS